MAAVTIDISSEYTDDLYEGRATELSDDYVTILFEWSGVSGYPEVIIEQSFTDDEYDDWYPLYQQRTNYEEPVKFRINDTAGKYALNLHPIFASTVYVRVKMRMNGSTAGEVIYNMSVGA